MGIPNPVVADEALYPAVDAAFGFVLPSYQLLATRFEAADNRITSLVTLSLSLTLGAPVFAKALRPEVAFNAPAFLVATCLAILCVAVGIVGRARGKLVLPDPMVMYDKSLRRSDHSFKMAQIYFAGANFDANANAIRTKGNFATVMTVALGLEVWMFILWLTLS